MHHYSAYALSIGSEFSLPELPVTSLPASPEVHFRRGSLGHLCPSGDRVPHGSVQLGPGQRLFWEPGATFWVGHGQEAVVDTQEEPLSPWVRFLLAGRTMATICLQRQRLVLHGCALAVGLPRKPNHRSSPIAPHMPGATLCLGNSGQGKSTTALTLWQRGHALITDDICAIDFPEPGVALVAPGYPRIKVSPQSAGALGLAYEDLLLVHPEVEERFLPADQAFCSAPQRVARIFILQTGPALRLQPLQGQEAFWAILRHTHWPLVMKDSGVEPLNFQKCAQLARQVPVYSLQVPRDLSGLTALAESIEGDGVGHPQPAGQDSVKPR